MYSRHDLVWLSNNGWQQARSTARPEHRHALNLWQQQNWPLIVRRHDADAAADVICLGLALPPDSIDGRKQRIALRVARQLIAKSTPALRLTDIIHAAPVRWQHHLGALALASAGLDLRAFGSVALQHLTGQSYVTASSDIDLLFYPKNPAELERGLPLLASFSAHLPLDGEIVFPNDQAVSWKEWQMATSPQSRVLVKAMGTVNLVSTASLLASFSPDLVMTKELAI
ncbi:malonate decarboxylase holo-[acyl-carrier-protein] synthase [Undibacterium sp. Jales W-56]|uniref:malonate decarboxylase holo-[acyl-carrier-protein] synthase n=1 Tax=Undibacterium sp. Jales W-56 TaxID=2897325 RepID=UPI0021D0F854|nr:malonate decarboxylase holo-[acyl-carrier-protein] synthase [Undibacterium sp. Jales W-56]MCU6434499.1 malonate decarboxylase holo-[acyl-carrier-protein] synthase [Undibacterium sp. Jales W-56]